jgi:hypothetical protein
MDIMDVVRVQVVNHLKGDISEPFDEVVAKFPDDQINAKAPHVVYSFWHILYHIDFHQRDMLDYMVNQKYKEPQFPKEYWPAQNQKTDRKGWDATVASIQKGTKTMIDIVNEKDIFAPIPFANNVTIYRCALIEANHKNYHLGELGVLRQVMNNWGPGHK